MNVIKTPFNTGNNGNNGNIALLQEDIKLLNLAYKDVSDKLNGRLLSKNYKEIRTFYAINRQSAITDASDVYIYFNLPDNLSKIVLITSILTIVSGTPSITYYITDDGERYSSVVGPFTTNNSTDITSYITTLGDKIIRFESNANATINIEIQITIDLKVR